MLGRRLTVKVLIPNAGLPDSFEENVAYTLTRMGHDVLQPPPSTAPGRYGSLPAHCRSLVEGARELAARGGITLRSRRERWLLAAVREHRPDMVLALTQQLAAELLAECRRQGVRHLVAWWGDPPAHMRRWGLLDRQWDLVCMADRDAVHKLRRVGLRAELLHEAMNPSWHRVLAGQRNGTVAVVGNWYAYRQMLTRGLIEAGVEVAMFGSPLPRWADPFLSGRHSGRYVVKEEKSRVFGEALASLNSTQFAEGNSLNCRAFEIAGAGGLQLMEPRAVVSECFEPGREVLVYDSIEEIVAHLDRARRFPAEVAPIREAAARRAHAQHTYELRLRTLFGYLGLAA